MALVTLSMAATACGGLAPSVTTFGVKAVLAEDEIYFEQVVAETRPAYEEELGRCMREEGFEYWPTDDTQEFEFATRMMELVYGSAYPTDAAEAEEVGFGVGPGFRRAFEEGLMSTDPTVPGREENMEYIHSLDDAAESAYIAARRRCQIEAYPELDGIYEVKERADSIRQRAEETTLARSDYGDLVGSWSDCMVGSELVHAVDTPEQLRQMVIDMYTESDPSLIPQLGEFDYEVYYSVFREEAALAVASYECGGTGKMKRKLDAIRQIELERAFAELQAESP